MRMKENVLCLLLLFFLSPVAWAGKLYFTIADNLDSNEFDSAELSISSGGSYTTSLDLGGNLLLQSEAESG